MNRSSKIGALGALALLAIGAGNVPARAQQEIPAHPDDLVFGSLDFEPPDPGPLRHEIAGGVPAYVVEGHELPLVSISVLMRTGSYTAQQTTPGLAGLTGSQMRNGGTASLAPAELDEELDFLAAQMGGGIGATSGNFNMNCLTKDLDRCLKLFFEMLHHPRFDADRLELAKSQLVQGMQRRNDSTTAIERREWGRLLRGTEHFSTIPTTQAGIEAITADDLRTFHDQAVVPSNFLFAVSGDVDTAEILDKIGNYLTDWPAGAASGAVPVPGHTPQPGLYLVNKADVNQGRVVIGHLGVMRDNPDRYAIMVMNNILGGGGFTSRVMSRVRSDEGLAYSAGCSYAFGTYYEGSFRCFFQSRSEAVARAAAIVLEEIERVRSEPVTDEEIATAKASFIDTFTRNFGSAAQIAGLFANLELTGRDPGYLKSYRANIAAVTADDVTRVARQYLHPDQLVMLVVGNVDDMLAGDPDHPEVTLQGLAPGASITRIPLPDPMTMVYPSGS